MIQSDEELLDKYLSPKNIKTTTKSSPDVSYIRFNMLKIEYKTSLEKYRSKAYKSSEH